MAKAEKKPRPFSLKPKYPLEVEEQIALFEYAAHREKQDARWALLFSIPNGMATTSPHQAVQAVRSGLRRGVPDVFLPVPVRPYSGLFVEMKRANGRPSDVTADQARWLARLQAAGYQTVVAMGWESARDEINAYLDPK